MDSEPTAPVAEQGETITTITLSPVEAMLVTLAKQERDRRIMDAHLAFKLAVEPLCAAHGWGPGWSVNFRDEPGGGISASAHLG